MLNKILVFILAISINTSLAQIPAGYYDAANGLSCQPLKTALKQIVTNGSTELSYSPGIWNLFLYSDMRRNDANTQNIMWDMYTDLPSGSTYSDNTSEIEFIYGADQDNGFGGTFEGEYYNREHSFPQSWFADAMPMRSDAHHIFASDKKVNGIRGNYPFGNVNESNTGAPNFYKSKNLSYLGNPAAGLSYSGTVFEPIDEYKGDIARAQLYMAVRYEDQVNSWYLNGGGDQVLLSPSDETDPAVRLLKVYDSWYLQLLYSWHVQDPVSQKEIDRNNAIYYQQVETTPGVFAAQGNRNPFIDHPEYVFMIWQCAGLLPVTVIDFTARANNESVLLKWIVNNEINFSRYIIERSADGQNFSSIGEVNGRNDLNYEFRDQYPANVAVAYYRLRLVDADGRFNYGKTVSVRMDRQTGQLAYPNPARNFINTELSKAVSGNASAEIIDQEGRIIRRKNLSIGTRKLTINTSGLPAGKYHLRIVDNGTVTVSPFVIER